MESISIEERRHILNYFLGPCAASNPDQHDSFLKLYRDLVCLRSVEGSVIQIDEPVITSHGHLRELVSYLGTDPNLTREQFVTKALPEQDPSDEDLQEALSAIVQLGFMLSCEPDIFYPRGYCVSKWRPCRWQQNESFREFVSNAIPEHNRGAFNALEDQKLLKAWKLTDNCGITIVGTDDLAEHLLFDSQKQVLRVFHHMNWLQAKLETIVEQEEKPKVNRDSDRILPRQLLIETLETFHRILFPLATDKKGRSRKLLDRLITEAAFDRDIGTQSYRQWLPDSFDYLYWGERLQELAEYAKKPAPSSRLMAWLEKRPSERNALWIAIIGLFLAVFFGFLSCLIGLAQLWIAVLTWKYPVAAPN